MKTITRIGEKARYTDGQPLTALLLAAMLIGAAPGLALAACAPGDTGPCDDGRACTTDDRCDDGACVGQPSAIPASCDWAITGGNASGDTRSRTGNGVRILGSICGQEIHVEGGVAIAGDVVTTATDGTGVEFGAGASVEGDIVTGGASISSRSRHAGLPGLDASEVPGGTARVQDGGAGLDLDATGPNPLVSNCQAAIDSVEPTITTLDSTAFRSTEDAGDITIPSHSNVIITAKSRLNVLDFSNLIAMDWSTITLDGDSIPDVVFVLRVNRKLYLRYHSSIVLTGGAAPERVILYGREECRIGRSVVGAGTVFCPYDSLKMNDYTSWQGALIGGGDRIDMRRNSVLRHVPLEVAVP